MKRRMSSRARDSSGHAQHELKVHRRRDEPFGQQRQRLVDVPELVALELGHAPRCANAMREIADLRPRVDEDVIAEVERAAVERRHLGTTCEGAGPLVDAHADCAAGRCLDDDVGLLANRFDGLSEQIARLARRAIGVAHVKVDHRGAGFTTTRGFVGNLSCRNGNVRVLLARHLGADDRRGEDHVRPDGDIATRGERVSPR